MLQTDSVEFLSDDHYTWYGSFKKETGDVMLMAREGRIFGRLNINDISYEVQSLERGLSILVELDKEKLSNFTCGASDEPSSSTDQSNNHINSENSNNQRIASTSFTNVRVLVLFTTAANNAVGNINDVATLAIQQLNDAKYSSDVSTSDLHFTLAGTQFLNFGEDPRGDIGQDLEDLTNASTAQALRNNFDADLVVLLTNSNGRYGSIYGVAYVGPNDPQAYGIVEVSNATSTYTFAHEVGHMMGALHQRCTQYLTGSCGFTGDEYGYGFTYKTGIWPFRTEHKKHTIMHQLRSGYDRIAHFSNPNVDYGPKDEATGSVGSANVARVFRANASTIAEFRDYVAPYSVNIYGITSAAGGQSISLSASGSGGSLPYSYQWWVSTDGFGYVYAGTGSTLYYTMPSSSNLYVRVNSSDSGADSDIDYHTISNSGNQCIKNCPPELDPNLRIAEDDQHDDFDKQLSISIYPNPTRDFLTLALSNNGDTTSADIEVLDLQGKMIINWNAYHLNTGYNELELNLSALDEGVYLLRMLLGERTKTLRISKTFCYETAMEICLFGLPAFLRCL